MQRKCVHPSEGDDDVDVSCALVNGIDKKRKLSRDFVHSLLTTHYLMHYHSTRKPVMTRKSSELWEERFGRRDLGACESIVNK
jgi:hypothetical protein